MPAPCPVVRTRPRAPVALLLALAALVLAAPAAAHAGVLKRGSHGPAVEQLQRHLRIPADGVFGPQTARAVRRFQAHKRLTVDGIVGPRTAVALQLGTAPPAPAAHAGRRVRVPAELARIARCESGGNPRAVSADGSYRGKYQFDRQTWHAIGGAGDPAHAPEVEQDRRALKLLHERGTSPWPSCA